MSPALPLTLNRLADTGVSTFGQLIDAEQNEICKTLELGWHDNLPDKSCIPAGTYKMAPRFSPKHGLEVWTLQNVPGRSDIEIHVGNFSRDTLGCILLGSAYEDFGKADGDITGSKDAFARFMYLMRDVDDTTLEIVAAPVVETV